MELKNKLVLTVRCHCPIGKKRIIFVTTIFFYLQPSTIHRGGYLIKPIAIEFWQGQTNRLHDRIQFRRSDENVQADGELTHSGDNGWIYERLAP